MGTIYLDEEGVSMVVCERRCRVGELCESEKVIGDVDCEC